MPLRHNLVECPQINCTVPVPGVAVLELGRPRKTMACPTANLLHAGPTSAP
jgi:hypothetical protein